MTYVPLVSIADVLSQLEQKLQQLKLANQKLERNSRDSASDSRAGRADTEARAAAAAANVDTAMVEETTLTRLQQHGGAFAMMAQPSAASPVRLGAMAGLAAVAAIVLAAVQQMV